ncbi:hypothetical protein QD357_31175, partial [Rhizobium sp. BR 317]
LYSTGDQNITVGKNTNLTAAGLISTDGQVNLDTGTLTWSDFVGSQKYQGYQVNADIDLYGGKDANGITQNNSSAEGKYQLDDVEQSVKATISGSGGSGNITIRNPDQQAALEQSGQTGTPAQINTDPTQLNVVTKDKHIDLEPYVSVQSVTAALNAGKTIAEVLGDMIDKLVEAGKLSPQDAEAAKKLEQYANDPNVQKQKAECAQRPSGTVCNIVVTETTYSSSESGNAITIPITSDTAGWLIKGAVGPILAGATAGLLAYAWNTNSGEQFIDKTISVGDGLQARISGNKDNGFLTLDIVLPDQSVSSITLGVTGTYGQFNVESAFGPDGQPLPAATLSDFISLVNKAGNGMQVVYNQKSGSGSGTSATGGSGATAGTPDPDDDGSNGSGGTSASKVPTQSSEVRSIVRESATQVEKNGFNVNSEAELESLFDKISAAGEETSAQGYDGIMKKLADGTRIGLRNESQTGGKTIDVFPKGGGSGYKIHIGPT